MKDLLSILLKFLFAIGLLLVPYSCVEPIELATDDFESILVVEGIITDEEKNQIIHLSRSYRLEENGPAPVSQAQVSVENSNGEAFEFRETSPGVYESVNKFNVEYGVNYTLQITTSNGAYNSTPVSTNSGTMISDVSSERNTFKDEEGIAITVSNSSQEDVNNYYKFEYEETYRIQSPYVTFFKFLIDEENELQLIPKEEEQQICYVTEKSQDIILSNTTGLSENRIDDFLIRFINDNDFQLSYRYSILVKQLKISAEAYSYYNVLQNLSETENIFSQYQPGFLSGNISAEDENDERVIGFFTTAAVDEQRHFFSFTDYFDEDDPRPTHVGPCESFPLTLDEIRVFVADGSAVYAGGSFMEGFTLISPGCVDCTRFGKNERPEFWID